MADANRIPQVPTPPQDPVTQAKNDFDRAWANLKNLRQNNPLLVMYYPDVPSGKISDEDMTGLYNEFRRRGFNRDTNKIPILDVAKNVHSQYGYLSEHHSTGETALKAGDYAEDMAMEMLATTIGLPDDASLTWDQREEQWKLSGKIYKTHNFTQSAEGHKDGYGLL